MILKRVFADMEPIPQDDGPRSVCAIDYPLAYQEAMGYLRAVLRADEQSERSLELTSLCLRYNPANYTNWHFRRQILASLSSAPEESKALNLTFYDLNKIESDLDFTSQIGGENPKNYQIWYHRRSLLEYVFSTIVDDDIDLVRQELKYVASVFEVDGKNYHAWSHRHWILKTVNHESLWKEELEFSKALIQKDIRNNSAWNQRWFTTHKGKGKESPSLTLEKAKSEIDYGMEKAIMDPFNESPWRYIVAIVQEQQRALSGTASQELLNMCDEKINHIRKKLDEKTGEGNKVESTQLLSAYVDILEMKESKKGYETAVDITRSLGEIHDPIRVKYWKLRENGILSKIQVSG